MDDILSSVDSEMAKLLGNHGIVCQRDSRTVNLEVTSLVDKLAHGGKRWMSEGHIWRNRSEHLRQRSVHLKENTVVKLLEPE